MKIFSFLLIVIAITITALSTGCKSGAGSNNTLYWGIDFDNIFFNSIAIDRSGNVYVVGGQSLNGNNMWVIKKFDVYGTEDTANWNKTIASGSSTGYGFAQSVAIDASGNVYVAGAGNNLISSISGIDWWIKKFDIQGVEDTANWDKKFDGNGGPDLIYSLTTDESGNVYVAGKGYVLVSNASGSDSGYDWWIKKFDSNGVEDTVFWNKKMDGHNGWDSANSIVTDTDGHVYVVGNMSEPYPNYPAGDYWWIKKFDANGTEDLINWNKKYNANFYGAATSVVIDNQGGVYVAGYGTNLVSSVSHDDWWIKKFSSTGIEDTVNWDKKVDDSNTNTVVHMFQSNKIDRVEATAIDKNGNLSVVGYGTTNVNDTLSWYSEGWIKRYDSNGIADTIHWDKKIGILQDSTYFSSNVRSVAVDSDANVYTIGTKNGKCFLKKYNSNGGDK